jgi:hypothetical protein
MERNLYEKDDKCTDKVVLKRYGLNRFGYLQKTKTDVIRRHSLPQLFLKLVPVVVTGLFTVMLYSKCLIVIVKRSAVI